MASENGRTSAGLSGQLFREPQRFEFFQAVRLLERVLHERARQNPRWQRYPVGSDQPPNREVVRFRALNSLSFPASAISQLRQPAPDGVAESDSPPPEMVVAFLGLTGPSGVLPHHYTQLLLKRLRAKDASLRDFLDLFHHRLVSQFYRAWEKYRLPFAYERSKLEPGGQGVDPVTHALYCLVGLGTPGLRGRLQVDDEAFLYYSGHFAHHPRTALALEGILEDYFELPMRVQQLQGQWLYLDSDDRALMPCREYPNGRNTQLGVNLVAGERVWEMQSKFRLLVGPLTYAQFRRLMPNGDSLRSLCQMTRTYVGPEFDFDVQLVLKAAEVPWCHLGGDPANGARLGWNTWVRYRKFTQDVADAVFSLEDV
jgi:type VI secretion system protein ImpH